MTAIAPTDTHTGTATYARLAELPLAVDSYSLEGLARPWSAEFTRRTTVVRLAGAGHDGLGEDVTYTSGDHDNFAPLALAGSFTLASFSLRLDELELFHRCPVREDSHAHRRWAFESAALDLALRQAGLSLAEALGREPHPVRFVVSMRLPDPPSIEPVLRRLELYPDLRFKLDVTRDWDEALIARLAATGAVDCVDFKAYYDGLPIDVGVDPELYRRVAGGLPRAWLEDPALTAATEPVLAPHASRITWDAPIRSVADIARLETRPRMVNLKPSRSGALRTLLDTLDHLEREGIGAYGGGQFEPRRRPRPDPAARRALPPRRAQRRRPARLPRDPARPPGQPAARPCRHGRLPMIDDRARVPQPEAPREPADRPPADQAGRCCPPVEQASCRASDAKAACRAAVRGEGCGCR